MAKRSLVVSLQGIGNALLALSLAKALHDAGDEVALLTLSPRALPLLQHAPQLNVVIAADAPMFRGAAGRARLLFELRRRRFDRAAFSFPSGANAYRLIRLAGVPQRFGHKYPEVGRASRLLTEALVPLRRGHDVDQNLQLAAALDLAHDPATHWPVLPIPNQRRDAARSYLTKQGLDPTARYVGLHTGCDGRWVEKRWPERHFAALAEMIHAKYGLPAIVMDGPAEAGTGRKVARLAKAPVHALDGWGDLADAWGLMGCCDLFVSNDSGLMNVAAASGLPTVAVFGPSESWRTRPYGPHGRAVFSDRPCAPCYGLGRYSGCPFPYAHCLADVTPAQTMAAVDELLTR